MSKKELPFEEPEAPLYGFFETKDYREANELIKTGRWLTQTVTPQGTFILKRFKA